MTHFIQRYVTVLLALVILTPHISFALTKEQPSETVQSTEQTSQTTNTAPSKESASAEKKETVEQASEEKDAPKKEQELAAPSASSSPGGSAPGNVQASSINVEPFSGSANFSIPISVPPGRAGIEPNLALGYSSGNRSLGLAGVGWSLDLGSIQRSTKKGVPSYDDTRDTFVLMQGSVSDLVKHPSTNRYMMEIEGAFAKIERFVDHWEMTDKKGVKYYFGNTDDSRQYDPADNSRVFRWALNKVEDLNGNYMTIFYLKDQNQIVPKTIDYGGNSSQNLAPYARVSINYVTTTPQSTSYMAGFKVTNGQIINTIDAIAGGKKQMSYVLNYEKSESTGRDLLKSIKQTPDGVSSLPLIRFSYSDSLAKGFELDTSWNVSSLPKFSQLINGRYADLGVRVVDLNGDGYSDFIRDYHNCSAAYVNSATLNLKNKTWGPSEGWKSNINNAGLGMNSRGFVDSCPDIDRYTGISLVDLNGDGRSDLVQSFRKGDTYIKHTKLNDGIGQFIDSGDWHFPNPMIINYEPVGANNGSGATGMGDINGDGFVDLAVSRGDIYPSNVSYLNRKGIVSTLNGWSYTSRYETPGDMDFGKGASLIDINGDGLSDIFYLNDGIARVFFNTGKGWQQESSGYSNTFGYGDMDTIMMDMNGDGLVDLVLGSAVVLINTGSGWRMDAAWGPAEFNTRNLGMQFLEANGDGMMDYAISISGSASKVYINRGKPADLLMSVNNGIGATSTIEYGSALHYPNTYLPFAIPVVKSTTITVANPVGASSSYTTQYSYAKGMWDVTYREFQGFGMVKVIDADGNYATTTFAQDHWLKGRPLEQASYDVNGNIYAKSVNQWQTQDILSNSATNQTAKFVYLKRTDNFTYDGTSVAGSNTNYQVYYGNATLDNSQKKFGNSSVRFTGTSSYVALPSSIDSNFGSGDFTIDFWVNTTSAGSFGLYNEYLADGFLNMSYDAGKLQLSKDSNGVMVLDLQAPTTFNLNTWYHVAAVRSGNTFYLFKDGVLLGSTTASVNLPYYDERVNIGRGFVAGAFKSLNGYIDEFRISKGVARWTSNFSIPAQDYSGACDSATKILLHFDSLAESGFCSSISIGHKRTAQEFTYGESPQYGDPTQVINYGEVDFVTGADVKSDRISSQMQYVYNPSNWLLGLPKYTLARDFDSNLISQTWFNYDSATDNNAIPTKGQLTSKTSWLGDPTQLDPVTKYSYDIYGNLETTTDPLGRMTTITYDTDVHMFPVTVTNALNQSVTTRYYGVQSVLTVGGQWGQTQSTTDANGQTVRFFYDIFGRPTSTVGPLDSVAKPSSITSYEQMPTYTKITSKARVESASTTLSTSGSDATIDSVSYYDGLGRLIESKSMGPNPGQYIVGGQTEYNNRGLAVKQYLPRFTNTDLNTIDPIDTSVPFSRTIYDPMGRAIKTVSTDETYANVVYDHWATTIYDENGHKQRSISDAYGRLIQKEEYKGADGRATDYPATPYTLYATTRYGYDPSGNLTSVTDTKGNITRIEYDHLNRKVGMDDPDMGIWSYGYDANGNLIWQRDAKGQTVRFSYDALNRLLNKTDGIPTGPINNFPTLAPVTASFNVAYHYDRTSQAYGKGRLGDVAYESKGLSASAGTATFVYDLLGRETASTKRIDNTIYSVSRQYDALNRLKQLQYPDGAQVDYRYNQAGQVVSVADVGAAGVISTQLAKVPGLLGVPEAYAQTASPNSSSYLGVYLMPSCYSTCTIGSTITFTASVTSYGATINRVEFYNGTAMVASDTTSPYTYTIPNASPGTYQVSAKVYTATASASSSSLSIVIPGTTTNYDYPRGSIQMTSPTSSAVFAPGANIPLKATVISSSTNVVQVMFYNDSRLLGVATPGSGNTYSLNWSSATTGTYPITPKMVLTGGGVISGATQLVTVRTPDPLPAQRYITQVDYNAFGQITQIQYGNGITTAYTYETLNKRLKRIYTTNSRADRIQDLTYRYDAAGQIMAITDALNTATQNFIYDELNRLVWAQGSYGTKTYVYDEIGNIIQKDGLTYSYAELNSRLDGTRAGPHAVTSLSDGTRFKYDANGNTAKLIKGNETTTYIYDPQNRLIAVDSQSTGSNGSTPPLAGQARIAQYAYDGDGGRIKKTVYRRDKAVYNVNTGTTLFDTIGAPPKPATAANPTVETTKYVGQLYEIQGNRSTRFIYLGSTRVASVSGQDVMYYHTDHLGGTNALTDKVGLPRELTEYDPFGSIIKHEKYGDDFGTAWYYFTGKSLDDETGLMYYGARYYNPKLGRFITADTIVQAPDNPQTLNRYTYCNNNPINNIDDTGHDWWGRFIKQIQKIIGQANRAIDKVLDPIVRKLEQITHSKWSFNVNVKFSKEISWGNDSDEDVINSARDRRVNENRNKSLKVEGTSYLLSSDESLSDLYNQVYSEEHPVTGPGLIHADGVFMLAAAIEMGIVRTTFQVINILKYLRNVNGNAKEIWSKGKQEDSIKNAYAHYLKHGKDFPEYKNSKQYLEGAHDFFSSPPKNSLQITRSNGEKVLYDPKENIMGIYGQNGTPKSFYKPDVSKHDFDTNLEYFYAQQR